LYAIRELLVRERILVFELSFQPRELGLTSLPGREGLRFPARQLDAPWYNQFYSSGENRYLDP
jgi:hypothetical protein